MKIIIIKVNTISHKNEIIKAKTGNIYKRPVFS